MIRANPCAQGMDNGFKKNGEYTSRISRETKTL